MLFLGDIFKGDIVGEVRAIKSLEDFFKDMGDFEAKELKKQDNGVRLEITTEKFPFPVEYVLWTVEQFKGSSKHSEYKKDIGESLKKMREHIAKTEEVYAHL